MSFLPSVLRWASRIDARALDRAHRIPTALLAEAAELGLFGLTLPTAYGGSELGLGATATILAAIAEHDRSVGTTIGLHAGLGTRGLVRWGTESQKDRWLPALASGRAIAAFAATEAGAGSHVAAVETTLARDVGRGHRLSGRKAFVTNGGLASVFTVLARDPDGPAGHSRQAKSLVLVERDAAGVAIGPEEHKLGLRASSTTEVVLDDVRLGADAVLGPAGDGLPELHAVLAHGRTLMAAGCLGTARAALGLAVAHVTTRRQFGRPLATIGLVREHVATMAARVLALGGALRFTTALGDRGDATFSAVSGALKVLASELAWRNADDAVQLLGGMGFLEDAGAAILLRDARITRIFEGANDVLRVQLGLDLLWPGARVLPRSVASSARLEARRYEARAAVLDDAVARAPKTPGVLAHQGPVAALADAALAQLALLGGIIAATDEQASLLALLELDTGRALERALARRTRERDALVEAASDVVYRDHAGRA